MKRSLIFSLSSLISIADASAMQQVDALLAPPPILHVQQETSQASEGFNAKAAVVTASRAQVVADYYAKFAVYNNFNDTQMQWTGNVANCVPGTISAAYQNATLGMINYYRTLAALPGNVTFSATHSAKNQAGAVMYSRNNDITHEPPSSWPCYTAGANDSAGHSNIALGAAGPAAIKMYVDDPGGGGNAAVGHRRWILFPPQTAMGSGSVPSNVGGPRTNALWSLGPFGSRPATPNGTAWPPRGFVPYQVLPLSSNRWSFSFPGANFSAASVTVTAVGGSTLAVTKEALVNGYGDNTIVFKPAGVVTAPPATDVTYNVAISGVSGNNVPATFSYSVTVIDPSKTPPPEKKKSSNVPVNFLLLN
ncbi:MAG: hypothetical protein V4805_08525 [Pseudomonadota bacterium]